MRAEGIEPSSSAWKADILPLNYARSVHILSYQSISAILLEELQKYGDTFSLLLISSINNPVLKETVSQLGKTKQPPSVVVLSDVHGYKNYLCNSPLT